MINLLSLIDCDHLVITRCAVYHESVFNKKDPQTVLNIKESENHQRQQARY